MAQIIINIPDENIQEILTAFDQMYQGRGNTTQGVWAKQKVIEFIKDIVLRNRESEAKKTVPSVSVDIS